MNSEESSSNVKGGPYSEVLHKDKQDNIQTIKREIHRKQTHKNALLLLLAVLLFMLSKLFICIPTPLQEEKYPLFFLSRNGAIYDLSLKNDDIIRQVITSSLDANRGTTKHDLPVLSETPTTLTKLSRYDSINTSGYSIDMIDKYSHNLLQKTKLFEHRNEDRTSFIFSVSKSKMLFADVSRLCTEGNQLSNLFWFVQQNSKWTKIPVDFGLNGNHSVLGWEILSKYSQIFFLLYSDESKKKYLVIYDFENYTLLKCVPIPKVLESDNLKFRILNGGTNLLVYKLKYADKHISFKGAFFEANELSIVKEVSYSNLNMGYDMDDDIVTASPNLRYIVFGGKALIVYDTVNNTIFMIDEFESQFWYRLFFNPRMNNKAALHSFTSLWSISFSDDSCIISGTNPLGDIFQWNVETRKRIRKISSMQ